MNARNNMLVSLRQRAEAVTDHMAPNIPALGAFIIFWQFACILIWINHGFETYENLFMRSLLAIGALPLAFLRRVPPSFRKMFPWYFLGFILFFGNYFTFFMTIRSEWTTDWSMSTLVTVMLIIVITYDWVFIVPLMSLAYLLAHLSVLILDGGVRYTHLDKEFLPSLVFAISGTLIVTRWKQTRHETSISLMKSLSSTIAHEMRSPLNSITLAINAVRTMLPERRNNTGNVSERVSIPDVTLNGIRDIIDRSADTIRRSNKIIDSILASMNGSELDRSHFKVYEAANIVRLTVASYAFTNPEEQSLIHLQLSDNFEFLGDRDLFSNLLFNLIDNALYYQSTRGFRIDIITAKKENSNCIIIRDNGPGVPADKREAIFEQFCTFGKTGGNGLGLSFCRRITDSFGGTIVCNSEPGAWTEFVIELPSTESKAMDNLKRELLTDRQVLIVDDQAPNRILLSKFVSDLNCKVDLAENGKIALDMAATKSYDLILMDIEMPVLTGDGAVQRLRDGGDLPPALRSHYRNIPVIGVTALPEKEAIQRTVKSGMDSYLLKPVRSNVIRELIYHSFFSEMSEKKRAPQENLAGASILLVDDNLMTLEFLKLFLEPIGSRLHLAGNGRDALALLQEQSFDLVIMDLEMPIMGGIETAKAIRSSEACRMVPIISLSGHTSRQTILEARQSGIDIHLGKPIRRYELLDAISTLITRNGKAEQTNTQYQTKKPSYTIMSNETEPLLDDSIITSLKELGDPELFAQLVGIFMTDTEQLIRQLDEALGNHDLETALRASHTLKGSAANIGANLMHHTSAEINNRLRTAGFPAENDWIEQLGKILKMTEQAFSEHENR
ncbi:MAG: response regulator [Chlorobiaceae bacterium]|nr:response regulator [Chlorobiaceae bacterium]